MLDGVQLSVLVGPGVVAPAPREVVDALSRVTVTCGAAESGFELRFALSADSPLHTIFLVAGGAMPPLLRVVLVAVVNGVQEVLIDGVVTHQQVTPGDGVHAELTVQGKDLTAVMAWDLVSFDGMPYPGMPAEARVLALLAKYAVLGIIPLVIPSVLIDIPIPTRHIPRQQGNDLAYIRALAEEVGYVFYLEPGPSPGMSRAYWGPEIKVGAPQPALNLNLGIARNVESLSFRIDGENNKIPVVWIQEETTKVPIPIPIPVVTPLNPPLGLVPPGFKGVESITGTSGYSPVRAAAIGLAKAAKNTDAVFADGSLDVARYGRILKARQLVGVRGAGMAFDGLYYVNRVTHELARGQYRQSFSLARNALVSTFPTVPA